MKVGKLDAEVLGPEGSSGKLRNMTQLEYKKETLDMDNPASNKLQLYTTNVPQKIYLEVNYVFY